MWNRGDLKRRGQAAFKKNYWYCVLVALVLTVFVSGGSSVLSGDIHNPFHDSGEEVNININGQNFEEIFDNLGEDLEESIFSGNQAFGGFSGSAAERALNEGVQMAGNLFSNLPVGVLTVVGSLGALFGLMAVAIGIFVFNVIEVGGCQFFMENSYSKPGPGLLFSGFNGGHYSSIVLTQFLRGLFTFLWTLLFVIPGIVKSYEYYMIPYLLAENPAMEREEAFRISKQMMHGNKWAAFVLDLSFIGWIILDAITFGLVGLFWLNPYRYATKAELFYALRPQQMS